MDWVKSGFAHRVPERYRKDDLSNAAINVCSGKGNIYGFLAQNNNDGSAVYLQIEDSAATGAFTPGWTLKVPAGALVGKDAQSFALINYQSGIRVRAASSRSGSGAPASDLTIDLWYEKL